MEKTPYLIDATTIIVSAYVSTNKVPRQELSQLIETISAALASADADQVRTDAQPRVLPFPLRKSITPDALISFEDGKAYRTLKRHLSVRGLTPDAYRQKWGLPGDYPMVCASYAAARSAMARKSGFGRKPAAPPRVPAPQPEPKRRGRPRKTSAPT